MTLEQLKNHVLNGAQHYYNKEQVISLLKKLKDIRHVESMKQPPAPTQSNQSSTLTLF